MSLLRAGAIACSVAAPPYGATMSRSPVGPRLSGPNPWPSSCDFEKALLSGYQAGTRIFRFVHWSNVTRRRVLRYIYQECPRMFLDSTHLMIFGTRWVWLTENACKEDFLISREGNVRRALLAVGVSLVLALMMLGPASAATSNIQAGNAVIDRNSVDTWVNFYVVDANQPFGADGDVSAWEVYAKTTNRVQLVVYRYSNGWSEVGRSGVVTPVLGYNQFALGSVIHVHAGDYVGLYFPESGSVAYSQNAADTLGVATGVVSYTNQGAGSVAFNNGASRVYSVRATGTATEQNQNNGGEDEEDSDNGEGRIGVCHVTGHGVVFIEVSQSGWENGHEGHGDWQVSSASDCVTSGSGSTSDTNDEDSVNVNGKGNGRHKR